MRLDEVLRAGQAHLVLKIGSLGDGSNVGDRASPFSSQEGYSFGPPVPPVPTLPPQPTAVSPEVNMAGLNGELRELLQEQVFLTAAQARRVFQLREQLETAHASIAEQEATHNVYKKRLEAAQRELERQLHQVDQRLTEALASLEEARRSGRVKEEHVAKQEAELRSEAKAMREERNAARERFREALEKESAEKRLRGALQTQLDALQQKHAEVVAKLETQRDENAELQGAIDAERARLLSRQYELTDELEDAKAERDGCEARLRQVQGELQAHRSSVNLKGDMEMELLMRVSERDAKLIQKGEEIQTLESQLQECKEKMDDMIEHNRLRFERSRKQVDEVAKDRNAMQLQIDALKSDLELYDKALAKAEKEKEERIAYGAKRQEELLLENQDLENRLRLYGREHDQHIAAEKAELKRRVEECERKLAEARLLNQKLEYMRNTSSQLHKEKDETERALSECEDKLKECERMLEAELRKTEPNADTLARARQKIEELTAQIDMMPGLQDSVELLKKIVTEKENKIKKCEAKLKESNELLEDYKEDILAHGRRHARALGIM